VQKLQQNHDFRPACYVSWQQMHVHARLAPYSLTKCGCCFTIASDG
jgi:hypothetical protein